MPNDPHSRRTKPAPPHPSGLAPLDDAPVFVAPAVDVRPNSVARSSMPPPMPVVPGADVHFTLPFPVEERKPSMPPPPDADDDAPLSAAPDTVDWERASKKLAGVPGPAVPTASSPVPSSDPVADQAEIEALTRDLAAIAALDERPDRVIDRAVAHRTTLARARALRFRLALLQAWPAQASALVATPGPLHLDLTIDAMLLVALADGAPSVFGPPSPLPVVAAMVDAFRALRPDLPRSVLRDRGAAAIARLTIVGWKSALEALGRSATSVPLDARRLALELAARTALLPTLDKGRIDDHRLGALQDLEKALALPTGSVAPAIHQARNGSR